MRVAFFVVLQNGRVGVRFEDVLVNVDQKTARPGGRIAHSFARFRVEHPDHHANDVTRGAKLAACPRGVEPAEQILVKIALHILVLRGNLHGIDRFAGFDEQARFVDLELGIRHLLGERAAAAAERLQEREDLFLDVLERVLRFQICPVRPAEFWIRKNRLTFLAPQPNVAFSILFGFIEALEEKQKRKLLDRIERIGKTARPEFVPERVNL